MIIKHSPSSSSSPHDEEANDECLEGQKAFKKGSWTTEEDTILADYVKKHGEGNWSLAEKQSGLARSGKSIRLRWLNHLNPDLKRGPFTEEEERKIVYLQAMFGNKWACIAAELPGRTDNEIKNFWHSRRKKLERAGLPLYPDGIHPRFLDGNQESSSFSSNQYVDISQPACSYSTTGSSMFEQGSGLSQFPLMVCPLNMHHNSLDSTCVSTAATTLLDQYIGLSGNTSIYEAMNAKSIHFLQCIETQQGSRRETHACSLPPFDETFDTYNQLHPPTGQTQLEPRSPRSNGYLEAIFYPPKVLEGSNDDSLHPCNTKWDEQGEPNSTEKEGLNQRDLTNQDDLLDLGWSWTATFCSKKDRYDLIKDTLYAIIDKDFHRHH